MRTTLDLPAPLFRTLKARAALQGCTLKSLVLDYVERGLREPAPPAAVAAPDRSWEDQLDPFTKSLLGLALPNDGSPAPDLDDYHAHLAQKHAPKATP